MTNPTQRRAQRRRAHRGHWAIPAAVIAASPAVVVALILRGSASSNDSVRTGETNSMGMPEIETPGEPIGGAEIDGIVASPGQWSLGRVPLDVAVRPAWQFRNVDRRCHRHHE